MDTVSHSQLGDSAIQVVSPANRQQLGSHWLVFGTVLLFLCLPVITTHYAPLVDYPSHLARAYILSQYSHTPIFQHNYVEVREVIPNLAIDLIVPALLHVVGIVAASRIFLFLMIVVFALGVRMLDAAIHGHPTRAAILCMFLIYNSMLLYGFVNYLFGVGMFCITLAVWLRWRDRLHAGLLLLIGILVFCVYVAHLMACAFLALAMFVDGVVRPSTRHWRTLLLGGALFIPELILYGIYYHPAAAGVSWGTVRQKVIAGLPLILSYNYRFDMLFLACLIVLSVYSLRFLRVAPNSKGAFATGCVFCLLYLASPHYWLGGSPVGARFILPTAILIVLSLTMEASSRTKNIIFSLCLLVFGIRITTIWKTWHFLDRRIEAQVQLFSLLPDGASLYPAVLPAESGNSMSKANRAFIHVAELATIVRHAFVPTQLAIPGQEVLLFRQRIPYRAPDRPSGEWTGTMRQYEFAWSFDLPADAEKALEANCELITQKDGFALWRVRK